MNTQTLDHAPHQALPKPSTAWPCTLVTGATSGLGLALTTQLVQAGVPVLALGRSAERLAELSRRLPQVQTILADLSALDALPALAADLMQRHPDLACVIHNAGVQEQLRLDDAGYGAAQIRAEMDINLLAPMLLTQALLPHLQTKQQAWVLNVGSGLGLVPKSTAAVYSASKAGLHLFSQALRVQLRGSSVRVLHAVLPLVDTAMTAGRGRNKMSANEAARQLLAGLWVGREDIWVGHARALPWLQRIAPGVLARIMQRS